MVAIPADTAVPVLPVRPDLGQQAQIAPATRLDVMDCFRSVRGKSLLAMVYRRSVAKDPSDTELRSMVHMAQDQIRDNRRIMTRVLGRSAVNFISNLAL